MNCQLAPIARKNQGGYGFPCRTDDDEASGANWQFIKKKPPANAGGLKYNFFRKELLLLHVGSSRALGTIDYFELNFISFTQCLEAIPRDSSVMYEDIVASILFDETETLRLIEPLHFSL